MPQTDAVDVPATIRLMQRTFGGDAALAARSTPSYMQLTTNADGIRDRNEIVAMLDALEM